MGRAKSVRRLIDEACFYRELSTRPAQGLEVESSVRFAAATPALWAGFWVKNVLLEIKKELASWPNLH